MDQFCSDPKDFVDLRQIMQMAKYFGFQRIELKKIKLMAAEEDTLRAQKRIDQASAVSGRSELSALFAVSTTSEAR